MPEHVHIGAGSFGLGMVVELCNRAGFRTVVLNRVSSKEHHKILAENGNYRVQFDDSSKNQITLSPQVHYYGSDDDPVAVASLAEPSVQLITTSVKKENFGAIAPLLARALQKRRKDEVGSPLCILACENFLHNSIELKKLIELHLPKDDRKHLLKEVFFCNTLVDRVCATVLCRKGEIEVPAESYFAWIVQAPATDLPALELLVSKKLITLADSLEFNCYEVQKYWCLNGIHLATAAYAYNHDASIVHFHNALAIREIREKVEVLQKEVALAFLLYRSRKGLQRRFPPKMVEDFNKAVFQRLARNQTDTIARVLKQQNPSGVFEILDRIERLIAPQCEILAARKHLVDPKYERVALHPDPEKAKERLELDDAITQVVIAMRNFAAQYVEQ